MIDYSINTLKKHKDIDNIIIVCHPDWIGQVIVEEPEELKEEYQAYLNILATAIAMRKP